MYFVGLQVAGGGGGGLIGSNLWYVEFVNVYFSHLQCS